MLSFLIAAALAFPGTEFAKAESLLTAEDFARHVNFLASEELAGRATGSEGQKSAATYVAAQFRKFGLEPAGDEKSFFQKFSVSPPRTARAGEAGKIEFLAGVERTAIPRGEFQPFAFSPNAEAKGELVFVGYALSSEELGYDDFAGIDVKGKIVLCLRRSPGEAKPDSKFGAVQNQIATFVKKAQNAAKAGAAGMILVNDMNHEEDQLTALFTGGERAEIPMLQMKRARAESIFRQAGKELKEAQAKIDETMKPGSFAFPGVRAEIRADIDKGSERKIPTENVVAILRGSDPELSKEFVIVGGHMDHVGMGEFGSMSRSRGKIHFGADDNASGTSAVIEVARVMSQIEPRPKRSVLFMAFTGEEMGLLGSKHYVEHPIVPLSKTVAMINLDMVGRSKEGNCEVGGIGSADGLEEMVWKLNEGIGLELKEDPKVSADSDHYSFAQKKIPILFFFTGFHADYHRPSDTAEKINAVDGARIAKLTLRCAYEFANREERYAFSESAKVGGRAGK